MLLTCPERCVSPITKSNQEELVGKQSGMSVLAFSHTFLSLVISFTPFLLYLEVGHFTKWTLFFSFFLISIAPVNLKNHIGIWNLFSGLQLEYKGSDIYEITFFPAKETSTNGSTRFFLSASPPNISLTVCAKASSTGEVSKIKLRWLLLLLLLVLNNKLPVAILPKSSSLQI